MTDAHLWFLYPTFFHASFICCQWKVLAMVCSPFRTSTIPQINPSYFMKSKKLNCISCWKLLFKWLFFYRLIQELLLWFTRKFSLIWLIIVGFSFTWPHQGTERFLTLEQWVSDFKCILIFASLFRRLGIMHQWLWVYCNSLSHALVKFQAAQWELVIESCFTRLLNCINVI